jgi:L-alanine-DL-glutamate epimerase-like enolase superfamily enzyme
VTTVSARPETHIDSVQATAYEIPTATDKESDGTLEWNSTTLVLVEARCGEHTGLGYTYCDKTAATAINGKLADTVKDADALMPERTFARMNVQARNLGQTGLVAMAISAVDIALHDLKAKLLGVCLADALPRFHESVPIYGSGGFTSYSPEQLREQVEGWMSDGFRSVKIKVGRDKQADPERVKLVRSLVGHDVDVMVDGNGAYVPAEALEWAARFRDQGVRYFEEPVTSDDLAGMAFVRQRAPAGMAIAAGEYGWNIPYFHHMLEAGAVDILQADVTRCGGVTNMLRVDGLCKARSMPSSAHCAPAISAHVCCAMETIIHIEYFFDHYRIERMLFDGTLDPQQGCLTPDRSRPGLGLEFKREDAERYLVN